MTKRIFNLKNIICVLIAGLLIIGYAGSAKAANIAYANSETGYYILIEDDAELLTRDEVARLTEYMKPVTEYGNAVFKSISDNPYSSTESYARNYYDNLMGDDSGAIFVVDMDERYLWLELDGAIYKKLGKSFANTITDNTYTYASKGDYYTCAQMTFEQVYKVLDGQRIAQPMKYASNLLLSILLALMINFGIVNRASKLKGSPASELIKGAVKDVNVNDPQVYFVNETKTYSPVQSSSSGGGGGRSGGGGGRSGGGGHHSGGGGGHRF
ncbi:MAG: TPM domain-containing protein [Lachnospiraceae bacterium]|nr:TPM domain-containing protein [Lachnospiraceae bacterium]